jgi:hypothetical protein
MRKLMIFAALGGLTLASCAPVAGTGDGSPPPGDAPDQCKAAQYQSYIGRNRVSLPPKPDGETWRVTCTTCPVTMDYNPSRLNILYDQQTGLIRQMKCG